MGKLIAILAVIAVAGVLLIGGGAWYWWSNYGTEFLDSGKTAMLDGQASGRTLDEAGCMLRAIERHKADWNRTPPGRPTLSRIKTGHAGWGFWDTSLTRQDPTWFMRPS